ncbi:MAG: hypothetical protein Q4B28_03665 [bacterium]|nr:hypothetical protein [bacterium]
MKNLTINGKSFKLDTQVHQFLSDYLKRIAAFVDKQGIEPELHQDILQRVIDKLESYQQQKLKI